jgi:hypothetical protein
VQILWWLVPPVVATVLAMLWVSWLGREGRGQVDRDVAVRRMGEALSGPRSQAVRARPSGEPRTVRNPDRSGGVAVRPSSRSRESNTRRAS